MLTSRVSNKFARLAVMWCVALAGYGLCRYQIALPWTLSTVPYATFLILVGVGVRQVKKRIEAQNSYWNILLLFLVTFAASLSGRLDLAWNHIIPVVPLTIGAIAGTLMVFRLSVWIECHAKWCSSILQAIGKETYIVVAFSQVIIMCINHFFIVNALCKYVILVVVLVFLKYAKDRINRLVKVKIL